MKIQCSFLLSAGMLISTVAFAQNTAAISAPQATAKNSREYSVAAVLFQQQSGEYRALSWQAFEIARIRVNEAIKKKHTKPLAIITDLDETVLDNSMHQAQLVKDDTFFTKGVWSKWVSMQKADSLPGSVSFFQYVNSIKKPKITIFYISNRDSADLQSTINNMKQLGFPQLEAKNFMLNSEKGNKQKRRAKVMQDYHVIMQLGDNLNDFDDVYTHRSYDERKRLTDSLHLHFGTDYIALPNPMYGDWEGALYNYNYKSNQDSIRHQLLKGYK